MNASGAYMAVENMIRQRKIMLFELRHLTASLERRGLITPGEHQGLLRLGYMLLPKLPIDPAESYPPVGLSA
jgi:hypothetical protein